MKNSIIIASVLLGCGLHAAVPESKVSLYNRGSLEVYTVEGCANIKSKKTCTGELKIAPGGDTTISIKGAKSYDVSFILKGEVVATLKSVQANTNILAASGQAHYTKYPGGTDEHQSWDDPVTSEDITVKRSEIEKVIETLNNLLEK